MLRCARGLFERFRRFGTIAALTLLMSAGCDPDDTAVGRSGVAVSHRSSDTASEYRGRVKALEERINRDIEVRQRLNRDEATLAEAEPMALTNVYEERYRDWKDESLRVTPEERAALIEHVRAYPLPARSDPSSERQSQDTIEAIRAQVLAERAAEERR